jgi:predicted DNA-binding transcriptional regulator AlpA
MTFRELSRLAGVSYTTIYDRYQKGLRGDELIAPKKIKKGKPIEVEGTITTLPELSRKTGIFYQTLVRRYNKGLRGKELLSTKPLSKIKQYNYKGKMLTMEQIAVLENKSINAVRYNFYRYGDFAISDRSNLRVANAIVVCAINGVKYHTTELAQLLGISRQAVHLQYHKKTPAEFKKWVLQRMEQVTPEQKKEQLKNGKK